MITSSVLISAVFLLRYLAKGRLNPILQYALWIPVMLRLMIPVPLWDSRFSVLNLVPGNLSQSGTAFSADARPDGAAVGEESHAENSGDETEREADNTEGRKDWENGEEENTEDRTETETGVSQAGQDFLEVQDSRIAGEIPEQMQKGSTAGAESALSAAGILRFLWILGMLSVGGYMLFYQIKWKKYLRTNRKPLAGREIYRNRLSVYVVENLPSPCLSGKNIYLTPGMAEDPGCLEHILIHEYCHYRHFDFLWVIVRCVLVVVYWFHPFVWAAARASKQDSELACDAAAIRMLGEQERLAYGKTLLMLIAGGGCDRKRMGIVSAMSGGEKGIRDRIARIAGRPKYVAATAGIVLLSAAVAVLATFSGAAGEAGAAAEGREADRQKESAAENANDQSARQNQRQNQWQLLEAQQALELQQEQLQALEQEIMRQQQEVEQQSQRLEQELNAEVKESAVLKKLASYDAKIEETGSRPGVYAVRDALNTADYVQDYYEKGEAALEEGIYLLEVRKGSDSSDIKIYGLYSKEYGCEGIKILIGNDAGDFDVEWCMSFFNNREENIRLYESAEDGMPRTFAWKVLTENTSDAEVWDLYLCDRQNTGMIEQHMLQAEEFLEELGERLRFEIHAEECRIDVYDKEKKVGAISVEASPETMKSVQGVIMDDSTAAWELGSSEEEIRMIIAVGLKLNGTDEIWYYRLPVLSFPVACGTFGERAFRIGQASVDTDFVNGKRPAGAKSLDAFLTLEKESAASQADGTGIRQDGADVLSTAFAADDGNGHYDVEILYTNPCPSYTRVSDSFGTRINPVTGEKRLHNGIDLAAEKGADIVAAAEGTVYQTGFDGTYGNYIVLYHVLNGEFTYYAGCQDVLAEEGDSVAAGQKIATAGSTGRSTGPHLHFAVSRNGEYIEPAFE